MLLDATSIRKTLCYQPEDYGLESLHCSEDAASPRYYLSLIQELHPTCPYDTGSFKKFSFRQTATVLRRNHRPDYHLVLLG